MSDAKKNTTFENKGRGGRIPFILPAVVALCSMFGGCAPRSPVSLARGAPPPTAVKEVGETVVTGRVTDTEGRPIAGAKQLESIPRQKHGVGTGPTGQVLRFDGRDDFIHIPPAAQFDLRGNVTVSAWVKVDPECGEAPIFYRGDMQRGHDPYQLNIYPPKVRFIVDGASGNHQGQVMATAPLDAGWHLWTGVRDIDAGRLLLYKDGQLVGAVSDAAPYQYKTSEMYNEIGSVDSGAWGGSWGFFKGEIDQLSVWNVARKPAEIQHELAHGLKGNEPGLVALWTFDKDGQTVNDASSFKCHATLGRTPEPDASDPTRVPAGESTTDVKVVGKNESKALGQSVQAVEVNDGVHIRAFIDGVDTIKIRGDELWYEHHAWDLPGKWWNRMDNTRHDEPTYINGTAWKPEWQDNVSKPYRLVGNALPRETNAHVVVTKTAGRGKVSVTDTPKPENDYTLSVQFDDDMPFAGADWYEVVVRWGPHVALQGAQAPSESASAPTSLKPIPSAKDLPGALIFEGRYIHRSRGREYDQPASLWIKQGKDGAISVLSHLFFFKETALAVGDATHRPVCYAASREPVGRYPAFEARLEFREDNAVQTRHWGDEREDGKECAIDRGALFDLNSRPDPYAVANILVRRFDLKPGESKEFTMCDWGDSERGKGTFPSYRVRVEHKGKETVTVRAGTFEANHLVLTQMTSANTWFKKQAGHVTDFWVLDNRMVVRILRHREPYETELLDWTVPATLPGLIQRRDGSAAIGTDPSE